MKQSLPTTKLILALFFLMLAITPSCKKGSKEPGSEEKPPEIAKITLKLDKTTFNQAEAVEVNYEGSLSENSLTATIGTEQVALTKVDGKLLFIIPATTKGNVEIKGAKLDKSYAITINEVKISVPPTTYLVTYMADRQQIFEGLQASLDSLVLSGVLTQQVAGKQYAAVTDSLDNVIKRFNQLPEDQKLVAVKYLEANSAELNEINTIIKDVLRPQLSKLAVLSLKNQRNPTFVTQCAQDELLKQVRCIIAKDIIPLVFKISAFTLLAHESAVILATSGVGALLGAAVGVGIIYFKVIPAVLELKAGLWEIGRRCINYVGEASQQITGNAINPYKINSLALTAVALIPEYRNNVANPLNYRLKARNIQPDKDASTFADLFSAYNKFLNLWQLPKAATVFGAVPKWPSEVSKYILPARLSYISVITDNPKVTGSVSGTVDEMKINFKTTETTDQSFNYTIIYNDGSFGEIKNAPTAALLIIQDPYTQPMSGTANFDSDAYSQPTGLKLAFKNTIRTGANTIAGDCTINIINNGFKIDYKFEGTINGNKLVIRISEPNDGRLWHVLNLTLSANGKQYTGTGTQEGCSSCIMGNIVLNVGQ